MRSSGAVAVAKKSPKRKPAEGPAKPEIDRTGWSKQPVVFQVRGTPEFKESLERLAEFAGHRSLAAMFEVAIRHYAREIKFPETLPKR